MTTVFYNVPRATVAQEHIQYPTIVVLDVPAVICALLILIYPVYPSKYKIQKFPKCCYSQVH